MQQAQTTSHRDSPVNPPIASLNGMPQIMFQAAIRSRPVIQSGNTFPAQKAMAHSTLPRTRMPCASMPARGGSRQKQARTARPAAAATVFLSFFVSPNVIYFPQAKPASMAFLFSSRNWVLLASLCSTVSVISSFVKRPVPAA